MITTMTMMTAMMAKTGNEHGEEDHGGDGCSGAKEIERAVIDVKTVKMIVMMLTMTMVNGRRSLDTASPADSVRPQGWPLSFFSPWLSRCLNDVCSRTLSLFKLWVFSKLATSCWADVCSTELPARFDPKQRTARSQRRGAGWGRTSGRVRDGWAGAKVGVLKF